MGIVKFRLEISSLKIFREHIWTQETLNVLDALLTSLLQRSLLKWMDNGQMKVCVLHQHLYAKHEEWVS